MWNPQNGPGGAEGLAGTREDAAKGRVSMGRRPGHRGSPDAPAGRVGPEEPSWKCAPTHWTGAPWKGELTWSPADAEMGPPRKPAPSSSPRGTHRLCAGGS